VLAAVLREAVLFHRQRAENEARCRVGRWGARHSAITNALAFAGTSFAESPSQT